MSAVRQPALRRHPAEVHGLPLTATPDAAGHYLDGVARLIIGDPAAELSLRRAIAADPGFALAHVALGILVPDAGYADRALALRPGISRRERQHVEVLAAYEHGDESRATALAREHLAEFPKDLLIVRQIAVVTPPPERDRLFAAMSPSFPGDPLFWALRLSCAPYTTSAVRP